MVETELYTGTMPPDLMCGGRALCEFTAAVIERVGDINIARNVDLRHNTAGLLKRGSPAAGAVYRRAPRIRRLQLL